MTKDYFAHKAETFEQNKSRVDNVGNIADAILAAVRLDKAMHLMDFGSGTGLLLERVAPHVGKITAVDVSPAMNGQLRAKLERLPCEVELRELDLEKHDLPVRFDGVISSMTLHHIQDVQAMLTKFHAMLREGGFIALSDLDKEDGSFHTEDTGVFHAGFDREEIARIATAAGFHEVAISSASVISKPQGDYPIFLLTGRR